jgi:N-methylhydantoinase A
VRLEVPERMDADGKVVTPLDEAVGEAAKALLREAGCEAVVIHFLHSYINPAHERRAAEIVRGLWPNAYVTAGHAILSEYREYERGVTAAVNASVQPVLDRYIRRLSARAQGARATTGPAGDAGQWRHGLGRHLSPRRGQHGDVRPGLGRDGRGLYRPGRRHPNLITYDMGGTSTDVG